MDIVCQKCKTLFEEDTYWWNYSGLGYNTKLVKCPKCSTITVLEYEEEIDRTSWYYEYKGELNGISG